MDSSSLCVRAKSLELCLTLCDPVDSSPPGSSVHWGLPRPEYWRGLPLPSPGDLPNPGIKPGSPVSLVLAGVFFTTSTTWEFRTVNPKFLNYPFPFPFGNHKLVLYVYESVSVL